MEKEEKIKIIKWKKEGYGKFEAVIVDGKLSDFVACERKSIATIYSEDTKFLIAVRDVINDLLKEVKQ